MPSAVLFVGTYTQKEDHVDGKGVGIYSFSLDLASGALTPLATTENVGVNPSYIAASSGVLYAVNEVAIASQSSPDKTTGQVRALAIEHGGKLRPLNVVETHGAYPCHVAVSPNGDFIAASNYGGGNFSLHAVNAHDGSLSEATDVHAFTGGSHAVPSRQEASHIHSTKWIKHANGIQSLLAADLGNDVVAQFVLDADAKKVHANKAVPFAKRPPGSGPRHIAVQSALNVAYVVDELSNTVGVHPIDAATGALSAQPIQLISTLPQDYQGPSNLAADIGVSTCGKFLYASNRGDDSIASYRINTETNGTLELIGFVPTRGQAPRAFLIHQSFLFAANQNSDTIEVFAIDSETGELKFTGHNVTCPTPVSLVVV